MATVDGGKHKLRRNESELKDPSSAIMVPFAWLSDPRLRPALRPAARPQKPSESFDRRLGYAQEPDNEPTRVPINSLHRTMPVPISSANPYRAPYPVRVSGQTQGQRFQQFPRRVDGSIHPGRRYSRYVSEAQPSSPGTATFQRRTAMLADGDGDEPRAPGLKFDFDVFTGPPPGPPRSIPAPAGFNPSRLPVVPGPVYDVPPRVGVFGKLFQWLF